MILLALVLHVIAGKLKGSSEEDTLELRDDGNH
jgi:signal peptidase